MSLAEATVGQWLIHSALGGGLLLLLTWVAMRLTRQPARRQRLGEIGVTAALLVALLSLAPAWLVVRVPVPAPESHASAAPILLEKIVETPTLEAVDPAPLPKEAGDDLAFNSAPVEPIAPPIAAESAPPSNRPDVSWLALFTLAYGFGAAFLLGRWLLGYLGLWRLLRTAHPAPPAVAHLFAAMTPGPGRPRLLVARRLQVPLSCGLLRPTVVLPVVLCDAPEAELRWVFAHELTHLERRDPWTCLLFAVGQAVFFHVPWFWLVRRQVQLCQEYVADATAAAEAEHRADYAEFLLTLTAAPLAPACATGVSGHTSDLFRRIAMLLQNPLAVERRCPRLWSLATAGGLLSMAVLTAGVGLRADAAAPNADRVALASADDTKKDEPKKDEPKKETGKRDDTKKGDKDEPKKDRKRILGGDFEMPDFEEILKNLPQNLDPEKLAEIRKQMEQMRGEFRKRMDEMRRNMPEGGRFPLRGGLRAFAGQGRLGIRVERPTPVLADQLDLPKGRGLVVEDVQPDSAAAKAGLKTHDILLQFNGKAVSNDPAEFTELVRETKANATVEIVVKRKGKDETIKGLSLPELKTEPKLRPRGPGNIRETLPFTVPPAKIDAVFDFQTPTNVL